MTGFVCVVYACKLTAEAHPLGDCDRKMCSCLPQVDMRHWDHSPAVLPYRTALMIMYKDHWRFPCAVKPRGAGVCLSVACMLLAIAREPVTIEALAFTTLGLFLPWIMLVSRNLEYMSAMNFLIFFSLPPPQKGWLLTVDKGQRMLVLHDGDYFSLCSFLFQDSKEYGHTYRSDLKEEILMLMARDQHPPEVGLFCSHW